jgi:hypothetical protein
MGGSINAGRYSRGGATPSDGKSALGLSKPGVGLRHSSSHNSVPQMHSTPGPVHRGKPMASNHQSNSSSSHAAPPTSGSNPNRGAPPTSSSPQGNGRGRMPPPSSGR